MWPTKRVRMEAKGKVDFMEAAMLEGVNNRHVFVVLSKVESFRAGRDGVIVLTMDSGKRIRVKGDLVTFSLRWFPKRENPFEWKRA